MMKTERSSARETLQQKIERLQNHAWIGDPAQRMGDLHVVITDMSDLIKSLLPAIEEALAEIEHCHGDMLTEEERSHPRGSGWGRVYDKLRAARDLVKGRAA